MRRSVRQVSARHSDTVRWSGEDRCLLAISLAAGLLVAGAAMAQIPPAIATVGEATVVTLHAESVQVYECKTGGDNAGSDKPGSDHKLVWTLREPIATLLLAGKTVGRHYAGPTWQHVDGSSVVGKVVANAPGKTPTDIPWLKLQATTRKGQGMLSGVATVQRINTQGGVHAGPCDKARTFYSAPYSADYVFLQKGG
jgi:Protein of unknown function (DUF3455)